MFAKFDYFDRLEQPTLVLCNPNDVELATIKNIDEFNLSVNFNAVSELSLTISKEPANPAYDLILLKRQILVKDVRTIGSEYSSEDLGYFIITDFNEIDGENGKAKTITATSCEIELNNLEVPYIPQSAEVGGETIEFAGTYYLYSTSEEHRSLLDVIMPAAPAWDFNVPIPALADLQRTFDENLDGTLYNFLMNKLAETYECIVEFDILNRVISFIPKQSALTQTSVFLSRGNFLNEVSLKESGSEYANCISVSGGDEEVGIGRVNPLGNGLMFDFSYDISQGLLSDELVTGLGLWKAKFEEQEPLYILAQRAYIVALEALTVASTEKDDTMIVLRSAEESKRIAYFGNSAALKLEADNRLSDAQDYYAAAVTTYDAAVVTLNSRISAITNIQNLVQFDAFLDEDQLIELSRIVKMATYKDEFIIVTESMTNDEKLDEMVILYDKTKRLLQGGVLEGICEPRREITVDCESFAFSERFSHYASQLQTGCLIDIEQPNEEITSYILQKIGINYTDKTIDLTFGNRYRISNPSSVFGDLYGNTSSMASIVASNYIEWGANKNRINELEVEREAAIQLNAQRVINSVNQRQEFSPNGSYFLSTNPLTGEPTEYGISIADGTMMFFTEYSKDEETGDVEYVGQMAVGRTVDGNGVDSYGLIGDAIVAATVTTDKLVVGAISKGTNLVFDGSFENREDVTGAGIRWGSSFTTLSDSFQRTGGFDGYQYYKGYWNNNSASGSLVLWDGYNSRYYRMETLEYYDYTLSYYYKAYFTSESTANTIATITFYSSSDVFLSQYTLTNVIESGTGWKRLSGRFKAPQHSAYSQIEIQAGNFSGTGAYIAFDGIMLEQSAFLNDFSAHIGDFVSRYTVINDEGIKVLNGKIQILNNAGDAVLNADEDGNLEIAGKITATSGEIGNWEVSVKKEGDTDLVLQSSNHRFGFNGNVGAGDDVAIWAGNSANNNLNPWEEAVATDWTTRFNFYVLQGGSMVAKRGTIGGWTITDSALYTKTTGLGKKVGIRKPDQFGDFAIFAGSYSDATSDAHIYTDIKVVGHDEYAVGFETGVWGGDGIWKAVDTFNGTTGTIENASIQNAGGYNGAWDIHLVSKSRFYIFATYISAISTGILRVSPRTFLSSDGLFHCEEASISGDITATSGTIGGWTIGTNESNKYLYSGSGATKVALNGSSSYSEFAIWCGADSTEEAPFKVTHGGALTCAGAKISGEITATSGTIGGWSIGTNESDKYLYSGSGATRVALNGSSSYSQFAIWCGADSTEYAPFKVTHGGALTCTNATITGTLTTGSIINSGAKIGGSSGLTVGSGVIKGNDNNYLDTSGFRIRAGELAGWTISPSEISASDSGRTLRLQANAGIFASQDSDNQYVSIDSRYVMAHLDTGSNSYNRNELLYDRCKITKRVSGVDAYSELLFDGVNTSSLEEKKEDIKEIESDFCCEVKNSKLYEYKFRNQDRKQMGFVIGRETPEEILSEDGNAINHFKCIVMLWKSVQELIYQNEQLISRVESLEMKIKERWW